MNDNKKIPARAATRNRGRQMKGGHKSLNHFIRELLGSQAQLERFCRIVEDAVIFYLLFAAVWSLCHVVGDLFMTWGVA